MESRIRSVFQISQFKWLNISAAVVLMGVFVSPFTVAAEEDMFVEEPIIKPQEERVEFDESKINVDDFEIGVYYGILNIEDFGSDAVMGAKIAYHLTEDFFFEASYGMSKAGKSSVETMGFLGPSELLTDEVREYTYYNLSVGYNLLPGESYFSEKRTYDTALYLIAGLGNTEFADDEFFTFSYGVGYRLLLNDWVAVHAVFKDHMFDIDLLGEDKTTHNAEMTLGMSLFF